jgi:2-amino-4-hydroxy-6-hydroxymethyldihydropteridine diphosphokinase
LLAQLQGIEAAAGRSRPFRNAPRTLDLDVLLYDALVLNDADLVLPHPRMWQRAFVLRPLAEIEPLLVSQAQLQAVADQPIWAL